MTPREPLLERHVEGGALTFIKIGRGVRCAVEDHEVFLSQRHRRSTSNKRVAPTTNSNGA